MRCSWRIWIIGLRTKRGRGLPRCSRPAKAASTKGGQVTGTIRLGCLIHSQIKLHQVLRGRFSMLYFGLSLGVLLLETGGAAGFCAPAIIPPGPLSTAILVVMLLG